MTSTSFPFRLRAWLELCRISNLPTVWTNVLVGCAVASGYGMQLVDKEGNVLPITPDWPMIGVMSLAMSLFYIGGMALNDLADADIDQRERPSRPIPSGRVSKPAALNFILTCFATGLALVWFFKPEAMVYSAILLALIVVYDFTHKRFSLSIFLMGGCRSMVVMAAAVGADAEVFDRTAVLLAIALGLYIVGITIIARGEVEDRIDQRKWLAIAMPLLVLSMFAIVRPAELAAPAIAGFLLSLWLASPVRFVLARPPKTIKAVLTWLSGICLVDAYFLTLLGAPMLAAIAGGCFVLTAWGHRRILGT